MHCTHLDTIGEDVVPATDGCAECLQSGDSWVHLRVCLSCGHVGCCDSSRNRHATLHFRETGHPIIRSDDPADAWLWCFADKMMIERESSSR